MTDERRYTLHEITGAMGEALKTLSFEERSEQSRVLRLFIDQTVDRLKTAPVPVEVDEDPLGR